jgi:hypothetical protein
MKIRRKVEIVIETHQIATIRTRGQRGTTRWCPMCAAKVHMVMPAEATEITGMMPSTVYRLVESGQVHFEQTAEGLLLICLSSLAATNTFTEPPPF